MTDPWVESHGLSLTREHDELGPVTTCGPAPRLSRTPGAPGHTRAQARFARPGDPGRTWPGEPLPNPAGFRGDTDRWCSGRLAFLPGRGFRAARENARPLSCAGTGFQDATATHFRCPTPLHRPWRWPRRRTHWAGRPPRWRRPPRRHGTPRPRPATPSTGGHRRTQGTCRCC